MSIEEYPKVCHDILVAASQVVQGWEDLFKTSSQTSTLNFPSLFSRLEGGMTNAVYKVGPVHPANIASNHNSASLVQRVGESSTETISNLSSISVPFASSSSSSTSSSATTSSSSPTFIIVRVVNQELDATIDRKKELDIISKSAALGIAPKLYGTATISLPVLRPNDAMKQITVRFEQYVEGRTLNLTDLRSIALAPYLAIVVARFHYQEDILAQHHQDHQQAQKEQQRVVVEGGGGFLKRPSLALAVQMKSYIKILQEVQLTYLNTAIRAKHWPENLQRLWNMPSSSSSSSSSSSATSSSSSSSSPPPPTTTSNSWADEVEWLLNITGISCSNDTSGISPGRAVEVESAGREAGSGERQEVTNTTTTSSSSSSSLSSSVSRSTPLTLSLGETVLSHGDLQENNWIIQDSGRLYLLDYEYSGMNPAGFDIGNLFCEHIPEYGGHYPCAYRWDGPHRYPCTTWQSTFAQAYVRERTRIHTTGTNEEEEEEAEAGAGGGGEKTDGGSTREEQRTATTLLHPLPLSLPPVRVPVPLSEQISSPAVGSLSSNDADNNDIDRSGFLAPSSSSSTSSSPLRTTPHTVITLTETLHTRTSISPQLLQTLFPEDEEVRSVIMQSRMGILASHLYWSLWSIVLGLGKVSIPADKEEGEEDDESEQQTITIETTTATTTGGGGSGTGVGRGGGGGSAEASTLIGGGTNQVHSFDYAAYGCHRAEEYFRLQAQLKTDLGLC